MLTNIIEFNLILNNKSFMKCKKLKVMQKYNF